MNKIGRNAPCPCGSGLKYKRCCEGKDLTAAFVDVLESLDPEEEAEIFIFDRVYQSILAGVWFAFHGSNSNLPDSNGLEEFYREIYGRDLDPALIDEIILPLSPRAVAQFQSTIVRTKDKIIDIASTDGQTELPPAPGTLPKSK